MYHFFSRILFLIGFLLGILLAIIFVRGASKSSSKNAQTKIDAKISNDSIYDVWFAKNNVKRNRIPIDLIRYRKTNYLTESEYLYDVIKVVCVILVRNTKNAKAADETWARSCNHVVFVNLDTQLKNKMLPIKKVRTNSSWPLLCHSLQTIPHYYNWILIVNDNTFAIVENLRRLVAGLNDLRGYYLGHAITFWATTYNVAQAGYALSKGALRALKSKLNSSESCSLGMTFWNQEDFYLGKHLESLYIIPEDTRDSVGLATFHGYNLQQLFFPSSTSLANYYKFSVFPAVCCSSLSVTFQAIEGDKMYTYYYLLHQLQIFTTGNLGNQAAATPMPPEKVWLSFLHERGIEKDSVSSDEYYKLWQDLVHDPTAFAQEMRKHNTDE